MSLEAKIAELTLAVQALTHAMKNHVENATPILVHAQIEEAQESIEKVEALPNESLTPASGAQSEPEPQTSSLTYDDVKRATNNLSAARGKEITIAALARFGVKRATELTQEQWAEYCSYTADCAAGKIDPREAA